jgi:hypothetical protein
VAALSTPPHIFKLDLGGDTLGEPGAAALEPGIGHFCAYQISKSAFMISRVVVWSSPISKLDLGEADITTTETGRLHAARNVQGFPVKIKPEIHN